MLTALDALQVDAGVSHLDEISMLREPVREDVPLQHLEPRGGRALVRGQTEFCSFKLLHLHRCIGNRAKARMRAWRWHWAWRVPAS